MFKKFVPFAPVYLQSDYHYVKWIMVSKSRIKIKMMTIPSLLHIKLLQNVCSTVPMELSNQIIGKLCCDGAVMLW